MSRKSTIVRHTRDEIKAKIAAGEDQTCADAPEADSLGEEFWSKAKLVMPRTKDAAFASVPVCSHGSGREGRAI